MIEQCGSAMDCLEAGVLGWRWGYLVNSSKSKVYHYLSVKKVRECRNKNVASLSFFEREKVRDAETKIFAG